MTPEQINVAIAEACGKTPLFVMVKHGLYYRPGASGYTDRIREAGVWPEDEARRLECSKGNSDEVKAMPARLPAYTTFLDAMATAEKTLTEAKDPNECEKTRYAFYLSVIANGWFDFEDYYRAVSMGDWPKECNVFATATATAAQRAEAFLRVKGLWGGGEVVTARIQRDPWPCCPVCKKPHESWDTPDLCGCGMQRCWIGGAEHPCGDCDACIANAVMPRPAKVHASK